MTTQSGHEWQPALCAPRFTRLVEHGGAVSIGHGVIRLRAGRYGTQPVQPARPEAGRRERFVWVRPADRPARLWVM